jgi:hypothetical protein
LWNDPSLENGNLYAFLSMAYMSRACIKKHLRRLLGISLPALMVVPALVSAQERSVESAATTGSDFFTRVIAHLKKNEVALDEYERIQRIEKRRTASDTSPLSTTCWRLFPTGPGVDKLPLTPEGKPPDAEIYRGELQKLEKYLVWAAEESTSQKEAYSRTQHKRKERFDLMDATHQAFRFTLEGKETRGDRTLLRYSMVPNPDYRPTTRNTVLFTRVRGTIWVDEQSSQLAKVDGSVTEDFSIALFLAKVYKGSHFMQERYEVAPGIWEPTFEQYDFDGRKFMVPFSIHERTLYSDYKRVGPPKEAVETVRTELSKLEPEESSR